MAKKASIKGVIVRNESKWIYDWLGWDATCPNDISSMLNEVDGKEDIIIEMNSPGGSVIPAHEIYTAIASYAGNIEIHVVGLAGSASSEILMACRSLISPVAQIMIHNCSTDASGDYRDMDSASQMLKSINQGIRNAYAAKTGLSDDKLAELMDKTTWMSAKEALEYGFVDEIMTFDKTANLASAVTNMAESNPSEMINTKYLSPDDISKLTSLIKKNDVQNLNTENIEPTQNQIPPDDAQACILDNNQSNQSEGGNIVRLEDLLKEHPEIQDEITQLQNAARQEGVIAERTRFQAIDQIAPSVSDELLQKAKYTEPMDASALALKVLADTQASGKKYFDAATQDSHDSGVDSVVTKPSDANADANDDALVDIAANAANAKRKGSK